MLDISLYVLDVKPDMLDISPHMLDISQYMLYMSLYVLDMSLDVLQDMSLDEGCYVEDEPEGWSRVSAASQTSDRGKTRAGNIML